MLKAPWVKQLLTLSLVIGLATAAVAQATGNFRELSWDDLMPMGFSDEALYADYDLSDFADDDPKALERYELFKEVLQSAPVIQSLNGELITLPGFALPLEGDNETTRLFLLVPYFGACIHVPPPPANQIVLVRANPGVKIDSLFAPVKVSGRLLVEATSTELADAGYTLDLEAIEPIEDFY